MEPNSYTLPPPPRSPPPPYSQLPQTCGKEDPNLSRKSLREENRACSSNFNNEEVINRSGYYPPSGPWLDDRANDPAEKAIDLGVEEGTGKDTNPELEKAAAEKAAAEKSNDGGADAGRRSVVRRFFEWVGSI